MPTAWPKQLKGRGSGVTFSFHHPDFPTAAGRAGLGDFDGGFVQP